MKKAALHNLGCKVNSYETEAMEELLIAAGYEIVPFSEVADVYVINTCSVTNVADRKSRQMIHKARKNNPNSCIVATGCYIQNFGKDIPDSLGADILLGNNKKTTLVEEINRFFKENNIAVNCDDINDGFIDYEDMHISRDAEHTRAFIKVQDGCNQFCSYCIIPYARGRVRSRSIADVIEEVTNLAGNGYKEVVLTGIHLSSFGQGTDENLADLIEAVAKVDGIERIRLGSLEPQIVTEDFAKRVSSINKMCPHFHLSLQSGCTKTLERMNRKYTAKEYMEGVKLLRKYFDNPALTTDIIVGFPGETDEDFEESLSFAKEVDFSEIHVFIFSKRAGTKAATMKEQVQDSVKKTRSEIMISSAEKMTKSYMNAFVGKEVQVLFEEYSEENNKKYFTGVSKEYLKCKVEVSRDVDLTNQIKTVKVVGMDTDSSYLRVEF